MDNLSRLKCNSSTIMCRKIIHSLFFSGFDPYAQPQQQQQQQFTDYSQQFQVPQQYSQQYQQQEYNNYNSDHVYYYNQIHNWRNWPIVRKGEWGMVYVSEGILQGTFAYYDDDQGNDQAVVNIGGPRVPPTYIVKLSELRKPPPAPAQYPTMLGY
mmetsp:Transcript_16928/g.19230  ORF Transcript_16928/g.19230 Transcript_16928/m.19230 type:complete len:155 (-) Transcript_16928:167-631(-)